MVLWNFGGPKQVNFPKFHLKKNEKRVKKKSLEWNFRQVFP
jgi:hypothetical protein